MPQLGPSQASHRRGTAPLLLSKHVELATQWWKGQPEPADLQARLQGGGRSTVTPGSHHQAQQGEGPGMAR